MGGVTCGQVVLGYMGRPVEQAMESKVVSRDSSMTSISSSLYVSALAFLSDEPQSVRQINPFLPTFGLGHVFLS